MQDRVTHRISLLLLMCFTGLAESQGQSTISVIPLDSILAGARTALQVEVTVGPKGLVQGEQVAVQLPPFWQRPQVSKFDSSAFITVTSNDPDPKFTLTIEGTSIDGFQSSTGISTVRATVADSNSVDPGSKLTFRFGNLPSSTLGIRVSRIAGTDRVIAEVRRYLGPILLTDESISESIEVLPGSAVRALCRLEPIIADGEHVRVRVVFLDANSNRDTRFNQTFRLSRSDGALYGDFAAANGYFETTIWLGSVGTDSVNIVTTSGMRATSNPCVVKQNAPLKIWWGDSHTHCSFSGHGSGTPYDLLRYARWTSLLDWVIYTEHDWIRDDLRYLALDLVNQADIPGQFSALQGLEWTSRMPYANANHSGHLTVVGRDNRPIVDINGSRYKTPLDVFAVASVQDYILFVNHPLGDYSYDWRFFEPAFVRNVEMVSDAFLGLRSNEFPAPAKYGRSVVDIIQHDYQVGFVGASDNHYSQPGVSTADHTKRSGLTAVFAPELTRGALYDALRARHNYATTGARILLEVTAGNAMMGDVIRIDDLQDRRIQLSFKVIAESKLELVEVVKNGTTLKLYSAFAGREMTDTISDSVDISPSSYYVRVKQVDQHMAWSSPIWVSENPIPIPPSEGAKRGKVMEFISNPNPSQQAFRISFKLAEGGPTRLSVYDILGRCIRTLVSTDLSAGDHVAWWTSETDNGVHATSGVYFAKIETPGATSTIRLLLVR